MQVVKKIVIAALLILFSFVSCSQQFYVNTAASQQWVDSVFNSLTVDQRIAQLMVVRLSEKTPGGVVFYADKVEKLIRDYNIGSICLFQGGPVKQANFINYFQQIAQDRKSTRLNSSHVSES